jgi:hypothetical protein
MEEEGVGVGVGVGGTEEEAGINTKLGEAPGARLMVVVELLLVSMMTAASLALQVKTTLEPSELTATTSFTKATGMVVTACVKVLMAYTFARAPSVT